MKRASTCWLSQGTGEYELAKASRHRLRRGVGSTREFMRRAGESDFENVPM